EDDGNADDGKAFENTQGEVLVGDRLQNRLAKTLDEALRLGDQIAILRDGEVIQQGTSKDIVLRPADAYIANFVKEVNRGR
ncbi:hypothetical protein AB9F38_35585, partial [Rhizobium leguminosarum]